MPKRWLLALSTIYEELIRHTLTKGLCGSRELTAVGLVTVGKRNVYSENEMQDVQSAFTLLRKELSSLEVPQFV